MPLFKENKPSGTQILMSRLGRRFGAPPFSVLDARQGWWISRKRSWKALGIRGEIGRATAEGHGKFMSYDIMRERLYDAKTGKKKGVLEDAEGFATSVFDPVLAELAYRWFCPPGGVVLDPFAGESTKGLVAACLGFGYLGVELRQDQVNVNRAQSKALGVSPNWVCGDSLKIKQLIAPGFAADLVFTSPPYYDLEDYGGGEGDGSTKQTYPEFMEWYSKIFRRTVGLLKENRFVVVKVGEIRDKETGVYYNFVGDTVRVFVDLGLHYYNEIILVTSVGSLPVRITRQFEAGRKIGKTHQNLLCFFKGDPREIKQVFREHEDA